MNLEIPRKSYVWYVTILCPLFLFSVPNYLNKELVREHPDDRTKQTNKPSLHKWKMKQRDKNQMSKDADVRLFRPLPIFKGQKKKKKTFQVFSFHYRQRLVHSIVIWRINLRPAWAVRFLHSADNIQAFAVPPIFWKSFHVCLMLILTYII